ncbi:DNA-directed DNA polymerase, partial [Tanacetum coccineum]
DDKDHFELKGQFLKELRDNTFSGSDHEDANEHIEKVLEIVDLFHEDLKTKFLSKYCPPARIVKKMKEINNIQQEPDETLYQAWERFKELLMKCPQHYLMKIQETASDAKVAIQEMAEYSQKWHNGISRTRMTEISNGLAIIQEQLNNTGREIKKVNEKVYAAQFGAPFQQGGQYKAAALRFYQRNNANPSYQERRQSMEELLRKFMSESAKRHEENSNLIKEIRASTDAAIRNQGASIKTLEIQIGQMRKSISTTVEADMTPIHRIGSSQYVVSAQQNNKLMFESRQMTIPFPSRLNDYYCDGKKGSYGLSLADLGASISVMPLSTYLNLGLDFIILDMLEDFKVPLILERPFLSTAHTNIDVLKRKITLRVGYEKIILKSMKPTSSLIKRVYMLSLRERVELDLEARLIGETLVFNRLLDPFYGDYIELINLNLLLELRRDQVDDLMPTIEEVVENMDGYRDQDMGDVIFGEPLCKASCVEARRSFCTVTLLEKKSTKLVKYQSSGI